MFNAKNVRPNLNLSPHVLPATSAIFAVKLARKYGKNDILQAGRERSFSLPVKSGRDGNLSTMGMDMNCIRRFFARRALERTMRPDPDLRTRRLAQFTAERRARYWANVDAALHPVD